MPRERSPKRDKAFEMWKDSSAKMKLKDIAAVLEVGETQVRKWKNQDKWDAKLKGTLPKGKGNVTKKRGAPKDNKNAVGHGAPPANSNSTKHGFFKRIFPNDPETMDIIESIELKSPLDILWENIVIQYTAIARAQRIMFVQDKDDLTKVLKRHKESSSNQADSWEKEWELQFAWDKHANFLQAQSRAITALHNLIARYEELLPGAIKHEEQRLRVEKLKVEIAALKPPEDEDDNLASLAQVLKESAKLVKPNGD